MSLRDETVFNGTILIGRLLEGVENLLNFVNEY